MALISCPYCGKQISDKSDACVHCGKKLSIVPQETKEVYFDKLSGFKQRAIFAEFISAYPEHNYGEAGTRQIRRAIGYAGSLFAVCGVCVVGLLLYLLNSQNIPILVSVILFTGVAVFITFVMICLCVSYSRYNKKVYISVKVFQKWLKEKKGLIYVPKLGGEKYRKIFDGINTENYPLR